jgi:hypothetical protein
MNDTLIIGWALNAIWLFHLGLRNKSSRRYKFIALLVLTIPYLGFILYFIFFVWDYPPPQPLYMRQNVPNHHGGTTFGNVPYGSISPRQTRRFHNAETEKGIESIPRIIRKTIWLRIGVLLIGLAFILSGLKATLVGDGSYRNWWGGHVSGPIAIFIGLLFIYVTTKTPRKKGDNERVE